MNRFVISILVLLASGTLPLGAQIPATAGTENDPLLTQAEQSVNIAQQAAGFDAALQAGAPETTVDRTDFWKLIGFLISPETFEDKGGRTAITITPTSRLSFEISGQEPQLRQALQDSLDADTEKKLLQGLDLTDDWSIAGKFRVYPFSRDALAPVLNKFLLETTVLKDASALAALRRRSLSPRIIELVKESSELIAQQRIALAQNDQLEANRLSQENLEVGREIGRLLAQTTNEDQVLKALGSIIRDNADNLNALQLGYRNNPQFHVTARHRTADDFVAPEEDLFGFTAQWGIPRLPERDRQRTEVDFTQWLKDNAKKRPHSFAIEGSWADKSDVSFPDNPSLNEREAREIKISGNWTTKFARGLLTVNGVAVGADQSFTVNYFNTDREGASTRLIINETVVFHLTDNLSFPISIIYANRQEFIEADEIRGKIGLSFSLRNKNAAGGS